MPFQPTEKSKLSEQLSRLKSRDWKRFQQFVNSPYHNQHAETIALFEVLHQQAHTQVQGGLGDTALWTMAFPQRPYNAARLRILKTYLLQLLHQFWTLEQLDRQPTVQNRLLLQALSQHGLTEAEQKHAVAVAAPHLDRPLVSIAQAREAFDWQITLLDLGFKTDNRSPELRLKGLFHTLDTHFIAVRLKYLCAHINAGTSLALQEAHPDLQATLQWAEQSDILAEPIVALYHHTLYLLLGREIPQRYPALRSLLHQHGADIDKDDLVNLYGFLVNFCLLRYREGQADFLTDTFDVYQEMDRLDLLFGRGDFTLHSVKNITAIGTHLRHFQWTREFIERAFPKLPLEAQQSHYHYAMAYLHFAEGRFGQAKKALLRAELVDPYYRITHHILLLQTYYETQDLEPFLALAVALSQYLRRNREISPSSREAALNLVRFARKLFYLRVQPHRSKALALREALDQTTPLNAKKWLIEKADGLVGGGGE